MGEINFRESRINGYGRATGSTHSIKSSAKLLKRLLCDRWYVCRFGLTPASNKNSNKQYRQPVVHIVSAEHELDATACTGSCTGDFSKSFHYPVVMKADFRISIKDVRRDKNLKIHLCRTPFGVRQFYVRMNGKNWPVDGRPVSLTKVLTSLRKSLVKAVNGP